MGAGEYYDSKNVVHGFVRSASDTITALDAERSTGTQSLGINTADTC